MTNILYVGLNPLMPAILHDAGFGYRTCGSIEDGNKALRELGTEFHLVLCDCALELNDDGFRFAKNLKKRGRKVLVLPYIDRVRGVPYFHLTPGFASNENKFAAKIRKIVDGYAAGESR